MPKKLVSKNILFLLELSWFLLFLIDVSSNNKEAPPRYLPQHNFYTILSAATLYNPFGFCTRWPLRIRQWLMHEVVKSAQCRLLFFQVIFLKRIYIFSAATAVLVAHAATLWSYEYITYFNTWPPHDWFECMLVYLCVCVFVYLPLLLLCTSTSSSHQLVQ